MPVNPFFNQVTHVGEQNLLDSLIVESIAIHGHSAYYIPREDADLDRLFGEDPLAFYSDAREIELYLNDTSFTSGQSEFISKFGLQIEDRATFLVSTTRFNQELGDRLVRPRENDIIFIQMTPTNRYLFEIRFVEDKEKIFQLGKLYTYELRCELMTYSHERVQTTIPEINAVAERDAYTLDIAMASGTGIYVLGETVYQGSSFLVATGSGTVADWNVTTQHLSVQNISGAFGGGAIIGITSGASHVPVETPDTAPVVHDPISDNDLITTEVETVVVNRGNNPRLN